MYDQLLMITGAARILYKSTATVRWYADTGRLPFVRADNGTRLFRESDVRQFALELADKLPTPVGEGVE